MIRSNRLSELASTIDGHQDPLTVASAFNSSVKKLYREYKDVTHMLVAGEAGLAYCLNRANLESDQNKEIELQKLARAIAFNTATNCWPGWGDDGIVIDEPNLNAGIKLALQCLDLTQQLALAPRALGGAHWLIGALELAAHRFDAARREFEQAERTYLSDGSLPAYVLMARGYLALTRKADPGSPTENAETLPQALDRLRAEGSKDAVFFADQIATANRLLFEV
jgi:hypothetical protein